MVLNDNVTVQGTKWSLFRMLATVLTTEQIETLAVSADFPS